MSLASPSCPASASKPVLQVLPVLLLSERRSTALFRVSRVSQGMRFQHSRLLREQSLMVLLPSRLAFESVLEQLPMAAARQTSDCSALKNSWPQAWWLQATKWLRTVPELRFLEPRGQGLVSEQLPGREILTTKWRWYCLASWPSPERRVVQLDQDRSKEHWSHDTAESS